MYCHSGIICVEGMLGGSPHIDYNNVPSVIYTHPVRIPVLIINRHVELSRRWLGLGVVKRS